MSQNAPMARLYKLISSSVRLGCRSDRISPHNPKVAGSNPAPATTEVSKTKGVNRVDPFGLRQLTMKFFDRFATHSASRPVNLTVRPKIDLNATNAERGLRPVRSRRFIDAADGHG